MAEFNVRADAVDVEQIMHQIRARIREKRGVDYTEEQIQELAKIKLEKFLDPEGRPLGPARAVPADRRDGPPADLRVRRPDAVSDRATRSSRFIRRLLQPVLKLFFSPNPLVQALHQQTQINRYLLDRAARDVLFYEVMHNLVVEMTRTGIEVKNMKMRVESIAGRLDFNERRARALEAVVQYKPEGRRRSQRARRGARPRGEAAPEPGGRGSAAEGHGGRASGAEAQAGAASPRGDQAPSAVDPVTGGESLRSRRRRRRRGRRSGPGFAGEGRATSDEGRGTDEGRRTGDEGQRGKRTEHRPQGDEQEQRAAAEAAAQVSPPANGHQRPTPRAEAPDSDPDPS